MKVKFNKLFLLFIIIVAIFLRFYNLSQVPPQPSVDEVSIGYNAYSILKTGADEYGSKFPILLRAYDDFRPALYVYLVIPFVKFLGLHVVSVRLPAVILSIISVIAVYFIAKYLTKDAPTFKFKDITISIAQVATLLFAISPWHIYISRLGHEVNAFLTFLLLGILFLFRFLEKQKWNLPLSSVFFGLSFDAYQNGKIVVPILIFAFFIMFQKELLKEKAYLIISIALGLIIIFPVLLGSIDENALIRYKATSLLGNSQAYFEEVDQRRQNSDSLGVIFDNRKFASVLLISNAYLSHFDPVWLFLNKGNEPFKAPNIGLLYLIELPLIFISMLFLLKSNLKTKNILILIIWGLVAILPGSITTGYPHAMRAFSFLPIPQILAAVGLISLLILIKKRPWQYLFFSVFATCIVVSTIWFIHSYFRLLPRELSHHFQYGAIEAFRGTESIDSKYDKVIVSNKDRLFESYMFYLFEKKYDPAIYQKKGGTISGGFAEEHRIGKYIFGKIEGNINKNSLYIINPMELTTGMNVVSEIKDMQGKTVLMIAESK